MANPILNAPPGFGTQRTSGNRNVLWGNGNASYMPAGQIIASADAADPLNSGDVRVIRAGNLLGKVTSGGLYGSSIIGVTGEALAGDETEIDIAAAVATELIRRQGATGTFKLTGPPVASGTVRTLTATYSGVAATAVTITALGVAALWTLTAPAGTDGGSYRLKVTTPDGTSATTGNLAFDADTATVDAAVEALANVGTGGVAAVYNAGTLTLTFISDLGAVQVETVNDTTNDGGAFEGGWAVVNTTAGVDGRFVTGSLIQPTDGSETILTITNDETGVRVLDDDGNAVNAEGTRLLIGGNIDTAQIVNYPADASTKAYVKAALNAVGNFVFSDSF